MTKTDYKKTLKMLYAPSAKEVTLVEVPEMKFLCIDGVGDPNLVPFQQATEALFKLSYGVKFAMKRGLFALDYTVMPLEGLWSMKDDRPYDLQDRDNWQWTIMVMQPDKVTAELLEQVREGLVAKGKGEASLLSGVRLETFREGLCVQTLHIGPYADEPATLARIYAFMENNGYLFAGKHHEIYLSDPRKAASDKMKTILRQPVAKQ